MTERLHWLEVAERALLMVKTFEGFFFLPKYSLMITTDISLVKLLQLPFKSFILMSWIYSPCLLFVFIVMDVSCFVYKLSHIGNCVSMYIPHSITTTFITKFRLMMPNTTLWISVWLHWTASFSVGSIECYQNKSRIISTIALWW